MKKIMVLGSLNMDFVISVKDVYKRQALVESRKREQYLNKIIPELNRGVFPKDDIEHVELEVTFKERNYQAVLKRVSLEGFSKTEQLLQLPEEKEYFIAVYRCV